MKKRPVITPEIIRALNRKSTVNIHANANTCDASVDIQQEPASQSNVEKKSFWRKAFEVIKEVAIVVVPIVRAVASLLSGISYFKNTFSRNKPSIA